MKKLLSAVVIVLPLPVLAQGQGQPQTAETQPPELGYTYAELRYLDTDGGGDGLRLRGSYALDNNWLIVGGLTSIDHNRFVDSTTLEIGAGYVHNYNDDFDIVAAVQFVNRDVDTLVGGDDDNGLSLSAGARGMLTEEFEVRGSVNHVNLDNNDTYLELAGDYYFSERLSAGASLEFAGDNDILSIGVRLYFR